MSDPHEDAAIEDTEHRLLTQAATGETIAAVVFFRAEEKS
jgi:hypothetical protein